MDEPKKQDPLTYAEKAAFVKNERELLAGWLENLSPEEARAWLDAHIDDLEAGMEEAQQEKADAEAVMRCAAPIVSEHPNMLIGTAMEIVRTKKNRTLAEAEALDAFERIKDKPLRP